MIETLAHGYSSESSQLELSNEYQHDRVQMVFNNLKEMIFIASISTHASSYCISTSGNNHIILNGCIRLNTIRKKAIQMLLGCDSK